MILFDKNIDRFLVAALTCGAIFLFYGIWSAAIALAVILAILFAKPIDGYFTNDWARTLFACSLVLVVSPLFRVLFPFDFCVGAPWSAVGEKAGIAFNLSNDELGVGDYIGSKLVQICADGLWSETGPNRFLGDLRDMYPLLGLAGVGLAIFKRDRKVSM